MNRADMRNYNTERESSARSTVNEDLLVRLALGAKSAIANFFASGRVRLAAACFGFIAFLICTVGFAAGVDGGSISFVYVIPFLAALIVVSFVMLTRGEKNSDVDNGEPQ